MLVAWIPDIFKRIGRYLVYGVKASWFYLVGFIFICVGKRRKLWGPIETDMKAAGTWEAEKRVIEKHMVRYQAVPYRPKPLNSIIEENIPLRIADAAANFYYFKADLPRYRRHVVEMGKYLENAARRESCGKHWPRYLHQKSTLEFLLGRPGEAAALNAKSAESYRKEGDNVRWLSHLGCTICVRVHTFAAGEEYYLDEAKRQLEGFATQLDAQLASAAAGSNEASDIQIYRFTTQCFNANVKHTSRPRIPARWSAP